MESLAVKQKPPGWLTMRLRDSDLVELIIPTDHGLIRCEVTIKDLTATDASVAIRAPRIVKIIRHKREDLSQ